MNRLGLYGLVILILSIIVISCSSPELSPDEIETDMDLAIVYPQETTELAGGQSFRITAILLNDQGDPIEGALIEAELWSPDGEWFARLTCLDKKSGRYLSEHIALPTRNSQGQWRITARAISEDGRSVQAEGLFVGQQSYSERLQDHFGFWIDLTDLLPYNVADAEDPLLKTYSYENGGYVILANNITTTQINNTFVILDVHWRQTDFPENTASATDYVLQLAGPHRISLDISPADLEVKKDTFLGAPAWHVSGYWKQDNALGDPRPDAPLDWMIFQCPGSETVWTILITTNDIKYLDDLQLIRDSFSCSSDRGE
jgi:hypothetical protein